MGYQGHTNINHTELWIVLGQFLNIGVWGLGLSCLSLSRISDPYSSSSVIMGYRDNGSLSSQQIQRQPAYLMLTCALFRRCANVAPLTE